MKTIEPPKLPPLEQRVYHVRCLHIECEALLEVMHTEFRFTDDQRDGSFYQINCPHCRRYITISEKKLSSYMVAVERANDKGLSDRNKIEENINSTQLQ